MTTLKTLTILAALVACGTSLAMAQNGPATGNEPPVAGGAGGYPGATGPNFRSKTPSHHAFKHHRMYMSTKSTHKATKGGY